MKNRSLSLLIGGLLACSAQAEQSNDAWSWSMSSGVPFFATPEVSYQTAGSDVRYYGNVKLGVSSGMAVGVERAFTSNKRHAVGAFIGSVGVRDGDSHCSTESDLDETLGCIIADIFDWERVDGVGVSYSYNGAGLGSKNWYTRIELGYGKGEESKRNLASGAIIVGYQF